MLTTQILTEPGQFQVLEDGWNSLAARFSNPLLRFEWFESALRVYGRGGGKVAIVIVRDGSELKAAAPFILDQSSAMAKLQVLGYQTGEPNGLLYAGEESLETLCESIMRQKLPFSIMRLSAGGTEVGAMRKVVGRNGILVVREHNTLTARVPLGTSWQEFEKSMPAKSRTTIRQRRKGIERQGSFQIQVLAPTETEIDRLLEDVLQIEASGWKGRVGTAMLVHEQTRRFFAEYARKAARLGMLRLFFLRVGSAAVAVQMAVEYGGRLWYLKQGFDERWATYAPGILLTHETIRYALGQGLSACEFLGSAEYWQRRWPIELDAYTTVRFYSWSSRGMLLLGHDAAGSVIRRAMQIRKDRSAKFISDRELTRTS